jgi:Icc protein
MLDSHIPHRSEGRLGEATLTDLDATLGSHPENPTLVFLHHPAFAVGSPWIDCMGLEDGEPLLVLLQRHPQVQALSAGHVHQAFDARRDGLRLLTTPSTCSQALPDQDTWVSDTKGPGFRWFELSAEGMKTGVLRAEGPPERWSQGGF